MGRWLTDLADVCRQAGVTVIEVDGWQSRSRGGAGGASTDGYEPDAPNHIIVHHTASNPGSDGWSDVNYMVYNHPDKPCGNLYLSRVPEIFVMAGGAANTNGTGEDPCGIVADDNMNAKSITIEAANNGVGEPWPAAQQNAYVALVAALGAAYGIAPAQVHSHFEWAPGRKIDPAGESRWAAGADMWDMTAFRDDITGGTTPPEPEPEPIPEEDDVPFACPLFVQATGADGNVPGAVFATDGRFQTVKWLNPYAYEDAKYWARAAGLSEDAVTPQQVDRIGSYGVLVNEAEYVAGNPK